jgi:hypothetical protein
VVCPQPGAERLESDYGAADNRHLGWERGEPVAGQP